LNGKRLLHPTTDSLFCFVSSGCNKLGPVRNGDRSAVCAGDFVTGSTPSVRVASLKSPGCGLPLRLAGDDDVLKLAQFGFRQRLFNTVGKLDEPLLDLRQLARLRSRLVRSLNPTVVGVTRNPDQISSRLDIATVSDRFEKRLCDLIGQLSRSADGLRL
jgi:hypothetical protein